MTSVPVGAEGLKWISNSLSRGLGLSRTFLEVVGLRSWYAYAIVRVGTPLEALSEPERGGIGTEPEMLAEFIAQVQPSGVLILEDELANAHDEAIIVDLECPHFSLGDELFHWVGYREGPSVDCLESLLSEGTSGYPTNLFVLGEDAEAFLTSTGEIDTRRLATRVRAVVVSAFDDEGYMAAVPDSVEGH